MATLIEIICADTEDVPEANNVAEEEVVEAAPTDANVAESSEKLIVEENPVVVVVEQVEE